MGKTTFRAIKLFLDVDLPRYSISLPFGSRSDFERFRKELAEMLSTSSGGDAL